MAHFVFGINGIILYINQTFDLLYCRYEMVKGINAEIESKLGSLIDKEIERNSISQQDILQEHETLVSRITDKIMASPQ